MSIYDYEVTKINGEKNKLQDYEGKVMLIVNTASKCGYTKQFEGLEQLYKDYQDQGFTVLGFPSNQFKEQDPGTNEEINEFCQLNYGVTFPMHAKIDVNGENEDPLYTYLKEAMYEPEISWNFNKFLVDQNGEVIKYYKQKVKPEDIKDDIEELLKRNN